MNEPKYTMIMKSLVVKILYNTYLTNINSTFEMGINRQTHTLRNKQKKNKNKNRVYNKAS